MQAQPSISPGVDTKAQERLVLEGRARSGANWFFWIGGLSIINTIIYMFGGTLSFIIGLGATQLVDGTIDALIHEYNPTPNGILRIHLLAIAIDIGIAGIFIVAGLLSHKKHRWALIAGMVLYVLDALLFIWVADYLGLIFHALALFGLFGGLTAMNRLRKLDSTGQVAVPYLPFTPQTSWFRSDVLRILGRSCAVYLGLLAILFVLGIVLAR